MRFVSWKCGHRALKYKSIGEKDRIIQVILYLMEFKFPLICSDYWVLRGLTLHSSKLMRGYIYIYIYFNFNFKRLYSTQIYKGKAKTCVLHSNVWRLLLRYMHTACIRATKKIIDWMTFILHTITYDQGNQTSYTDAQNLSQWASIYIYIYINIYIIYLYVYIFWFDRFLKLFYATWI